MEIQQTTVGTGPLRRPPAPDGPLIEVLLGADNEAAALGVINLTVKPGSGMPEHDHGPSTVVLIPVAGTAELIDVADADRALQLLPGTVTTIPVGRRVRLHNRAASTRRSSSLSHRPISLSRSPGGQPWPKRTSSPDTDLTRSTSSAMFVSAVEGVKHIVPVIVTK